MRRMTITLVALAVVLSACTAITGDASTTTTTTIRGTGSVESRGPTGERIFAASALQPFDSCNEFLDYVKKHAIERVGPYGLDGYGGYYLDDIAFATEESADRLAGATTTAPASGAIKGVDYSGTNVQVAGVDEPDVVKTDGERIFVVAQGTLYWVDASGTPEIVDSMSLEGWGQQLFLSGDTLLVMNSGGGYRAEPFFDGGIASEVYPGNSQRTVLTEVDVSDPGSMKAVRTLTFDGTMLSSRMSDGSVRVVVRSQPTGFAWAFPEGSGIRAEQKAIEANKKIIENSTLENWVPRSEEHTSELQSH